MIRDTGAIARVAPPNGVEGCEREDASGKPWEALGPLSFLFGLVARRISQQDADHVGHR